MNEKAFLGKLLRVEERCALNMDVTLLDRLDQLA